MQVNIVLLLQVVTSFTLIAGFVFGLLELGRSRRDRAEEGAQDVLSPRHSAGAHPGLVRNPGSA